MAYLNKQAEAKGEKGTDFNGKVTVNIDKLVLSNTAKVDAFAGTPLEGKVGNAAGEAKNILDFEAVITAVGADDNYKMTVDFDANPFAFVDMMKYSAKQDTNGDKVIDDKDKDTLDGQAFWQEKLVECLKKLGTAKIIVTKSNYGKSTFDAAKAAEEGVTAGDVIIYAKFDPSNEAEAVDLFIWNEAENKPATFGGLTFPMSLEFFADKMIKDSTIESGTTIPATSSAEPDIGEIFGYVETFMDYLEPLFSSFSASAKDMSFTIKYASLISDVVMPVIAALGDMTSLNLDTSWLEGNLEGILAAIFGTYVPAGEGTEAVITPAEEVVFTLESFKYAGTAIYPKAA